MSPFKFSYNHPDFPYTNIKYPVTDKQQQLRRCNKCNKFFSAWKSMELFPGFWNENETFKCYHCEGQK